MPGADRPEPLIAGRYRLGSRLGRGGMAEVFDAFDTRLERPVALKVLRPEVAVDAGMRQRFEGEARAAARLTHPSVVSVYDSGEHSGRAFLVMERLPGETLADRISRGPVDQVWLREVAADVLAALAAAHDIGLIHRDIKPGNILITEDGRAKVADFGIAKLTIGGGTDGDLTQVGLILGTPAYLAPERLAGEAATVGTDLYALGVVLFEAATGHKPQAGAADATVVGTGAAGGVPVQAGPPIDPALARVIRRSMAPRPEDRYPSAAAMAGDLARGDLGQAAVPPTVAMPPTVVAEPATRVLPAGPRPVAVPIDDERGPRRGLAVAIGLVVLLIVVVLVILLASSHHNKGPSTTTTTPTTAPTTTATTQAPATTAATTPPTLATTTTATTAPPTTQATTTTSTTLATTTTASTTTTTTAKATSGAAAPPAPPAAGP